MTKRSLRMDPFVGIFVTGFFTHSFLPSFEFPESERERERFVPTCVESIVSRKTITRSSSVKLAKQH